MKRFASLLVFFFGVIALSSLVSAQACTGNDIIFRISSNTNAHAETASGSTSGYINICYSEIFGSTPSDPYVCGTTTGNVPNKVLRLSGNTNAHAEDPFGNPQNYMVNVCYGNLACALKPINSETCEQEFGPNARAVVNLSSTTNAHLDIAGGFSNGYTLCCSASGQLNDAITDPHWEDGAGNRINVTYRGQTAYMVASTNLPEGTDIEITVVERDGLNGQDIDDPPYTVEATVLNGKIRGGFTFNSNVMDAHNDNTLECSISVGGGALEFTFSATNNGGVTGDSFGNVNTEGHLNVLCQDSPINPPPVAIIEAPEHRGIYFANTQVNFTSASYDVDAPIKEFLWTVEHNGQVEFTDNNESFSHTFTTGGMRTVTLRVTDSANQKNEDQVAIVILGESEMIAFINEPAHQEIIPTTENHPTVYFEANDSFVVEATGSGCSTTVACLAGNCPSQTENAPNGCSGTKTIPPVGINWQPITFEWVFREAGQVVHTISATAARVAGTFPFSRASNAFNDKRIDLTLKYDDETIESTSRVFTLGQCIQGGREFIQEDGTTLKTTDANNACKGPDAVAGNNDDCCIAGHECLDSGDGNYKCLPSTVVEDYNSCADYNAQECDDDPYNFAKPDNPNRDPSFDNLNCGEYENGALIECSCEWDNSDNKCDLVSTKTDVDTGCSYGSCAVRTLNPDVECKNGFVEYDIESTYTRPLSNSCDSASIDVDEQQCNAKEGKTVVPCGRLNFELGFFDYMQFISAMIVIFLIYLGLHYTKE